MKRNNPYKCNTFLSPFIHVLGELYSCMVVSIYHHHHTTTHHYNALVWFDGEQVLNNYTTQSGLNSQGIKTILSSTGFQRIGGVAGVKNKEK
jgi:hypothetical protein